jgi:outer membrane protein TolC
VAYREGEISLLEWLDTIRAYHEAESAYADLRSEYITRRAALERATGAPLF